MLHILCNRDVYAILLVMRKGKKLNCLGIRTRVFLVLLQDPSRPWRSFESSSVTATRGRTSWLQSRRSTFSHGFFFSLLKFFVLPFRALCHLCHGRGQLPGDGPATYIGEEESFSSSPDLQPNRPVAELRHCSPPWMRSRGGCQACTFRSLRSLFLSILTCRRSMREKMHETVVRIGFRRLSFALSSPTPPRAK